MCAIGKNHHTAAASQSMRPSLLQGLQHGQQRRLYRAMQGLLQRCQLMHHPPPSSVRQRISWPAILLGC